MKYTVCVPVTVYVEHKLRAVLNSELEIDVEAATPEQALDVLAAWLSRRMRSQRDA